VHPDADELCDGLDNNCDGDVDEGITDLVTYYEDWDDDGYGDPEYSEEACAPPAGYVLDDTDCNDIDDTVHPGAEDFAWDGIDQDCDGEDETDTDCIIDGVDDAMLDVMDTTWPVDDYFEDGFVADLTLSGQELNFDVLGTVITVVEAGTYYAAIPVEVSVNSEEDPFEILVDLAWPLPDTTCAGWVDSTDLDIYATIEVWVDEDGVLIADVVESESLWWGIDEASLELSGTGDSSCYYSYLDTLFFGGLTGFYDDVLLPEVVEKAAMSIELIDFYVELECTP
jgi:hypothetical protein